MIRLNVSEETLETGVGLERVVQNILWYQLFYKTSLGKDIKIIKLQKDMYEAREESPAYFKKMKFDGEYNLLKPLCDTATNTFIGRVPDIVSKGNDGEKSRISAFSLLQKHNDFEEEIGDSALQMSITGSGFLCLYADIGDSFPKYRSLDPVYTNVVYDCSIAQKRLFAYTIYYESNYDGGTNGRYCIIIYTKTKMYAYYTPQTSIPLNKNFSVYALQMFMVGGSQLTNVAEHGFKDIPIVEFQNNKLCISDCRSVLTIIALYSALQNNRFQNVEDIINYLLVIKNVRLGDDKQTNEALSLIKDHRVLPIEGDNTDAKFLSNPLNQKDIQTLAEEYKDLIHYITRIPDLTSVAFSQNASDPILKMKTKPLLDLCREKEKWFNKGYMKVLELTLDFVERNDPKLYNKIKFDLDNCDLVYSHALPSNDLDTTNMIVNLSNAGLCNPRVLLQGISAIPNVDEYIKGMKEYNEYVDNRNKSAENKNNGVNETNLERQNQKFQSSASADNLANATKGQAQNISDNKA